MNECHAWACGRTLYPEIADALVVGIWSLEAAAWGALGSMTVLSVLRATGRRWLPFWPTVAVTVAFCVGRVTGGY